MKLLCKIVIFLSPYIVFGQQSYSIQNKIDWYSEDQIQNQEVFNPFGSFRGAIRSSNNPRVPLYRMEVPVTGPGKLKVNILPIQTEVIASKKNSNLVSETLISNSYDVQSEILKEKNQYKAVIGIQTIRKISADQYEKLLEFRLEFVHEKETTINYRTTPNYTRQSILGSGTIYKIAVDKPGFYRIDKNYIEKNLKLNISSLNPQNIHIYGNGGTKLPEANEIAREDDLAENHIYVSGSEDGVFNDQDYIIFYASGPDLLKYSDQIADFEMTKNPYGFKSYFYLKIDNQAGLRINKINSLDQAEYQTQQGLQCLHYQKELNNLLDLGDCTHGTGQQWFGEDLSNSRTLDLGNFFSFNGIDFSKKVKLRSGFASRSDRSTQLQININNQTISKFLGTINYSCTSTFASYNLIAEEISLNEDLARVKINFPNIAASSNGWLDYIQMTAWRNLSYQNEALIIFDPNSYQYNTSEYTIQHQANQNSMVWDISDPLRPIQIGYKSIGDKIVFADQSRDQYKTYSLFNSSQIQNSPEYIGTVENQNIHALDKLDFVVIYPDLMEAEAKRLLDHRSSFSNLKGEMVKIDDVYQEFGSGTKDPTALRDFIRMLYTRGPNFRYVILMGNATFDYRYINNTRYPDNNFVPTFQTAQSLDPIDGFPSDDYFALMDENEGKSLAGLIDLSVGRILARNPEEAKIQIDKIIKYDTDPLMMEDWRLKMSFIGDDEDGNIHMTDINRVADDFLIKDPLYNQEKIYLDAYEQVTTPGGNRFPEVNSAINASVFSGNLIMTYLGHGGPTGLAQERVLQIPDINTWDNPDKLFLMITATCTFTTFDDPKITSAGQQGTLIKGGTMGLFSTVRPVYANDNYQLTNAVFQFIRVKENGKYLTLGEILIKAKNSNTGSFFTTNARKFMLFGDPSQTLAFPKSEVEISSMNGKTIQSANDTIRALGRVTFKGNIVNENKEIIKDFNGTLVATIYDKVIDLKTRGNDLGSRVQNFKVQKNVLFKGNAAVVNGEWEFSFIVPKDINYSYGYGKISLYATDLKDRDAAGYNSSIVVGGVASEGIGKDQPPVVQLFINNDQFVSGGITDRNPKIYAKLSDDMGINVTGNSIGHDLVAVLDKNSDNPIILNNFFKTKLNNFQEGEVSYPLKNLSPGKHTLSIVAWDITNNMGTADIEFNVIDEEGVVLDRILNYPNPFNKSTRFQFETNVTGLGMWVTIPIYSITGKIVKTIQKQIQLTGYRYEDLEWDGTDDFGSLLANGVYLYQIKISSSDTGIQLQKSSDHQKLVILR
ncbi:MAG: type IX secretion system sortase PorU [Saprospiraceae bacterium]|nr:type IX secretion system sortase PorU [Saprospiraceae bacterium]MBK9631850.1 type IX secretion system sortase PorU [Saprospiraceae bacterium]